MTMPMSDTDYPAVRRVMGEHRLRLDDDALEAALEELFPDSDPAHVESFMGTLQRFGNEVAPIAQRALPGAVQGAMTGGSVGGLYGALAGAAIGGVTGALTTPQSPARPAAPATPTAPVRPPAVPVQPPTTPVQPPGMPAQPSAMAAQPSAMAAQPSAMAAQASATPAQASAMPAQPSAAATTTPNPQMAARAAEALLAIITSQAMIEALQAVLMQHLGRSTVTVGDKQVPPAAFANAIAEFAAIAAENGTATEATSDYLYGDSGWPRGDLASPLERAEILLSDLREAVRDAEIPVSAYERVAYGWQTDD
jgi:hypothetical protein